MPKKSVDEPAVVLFVAEGRRFCGLLESKARRSKRQFLKQVLTRTVALYSAGLQLPNVTPEPGYNPAGEWFEKNKGLPLREQLKKNPKIQAHSRLYQRIKRNISLSLGGDLLYEKIFDPFQDHEPVTYAISYDLADIYCDVKEGLLAMDRSERVSTNIVWQWKFGLEYHWGRHAVSVISALHCLFFKT